MSLIYKHIEEKVLRQNGLDKPSFDRLSVEQQKPIIKAIREQLGKDRAAVNWDGSGISGAHQRLLCSNASDDEVAREAARNQLAKEGGLESFLGGGAGGAGASPFGWYGGEGGNTQESDSSRNNSRRKTNDSRPEQDDSGSEEQGPDDEIENNESPEEPPNAYDEGNDGYNLTQDPDARKTYEDKNELMDRAEENEENNKEPEIGEDVDKKTKSSDAAKEAGDTAADGAKELANAGKGVGSAAEGAAGAAEGAAAAGEAAAATAEAAAVAAEGTAAVAEGVAVGWPLLLAIAIAIIAFFIFMFLMQTIAAANPASEKEEGGPKNAVICIDAGHPPPGTEGEAEITLIVAKDAKTELESRGYKVIMTRTTSGAVSISDRPDICKAGGADFMYSFHAEGGNKGKPYHIYMHTDRTLSDESKHAASTIQDEVAKTIVGVSGIEDGSNIMEGNPRTNINRLGIFSGADTYGFPAVIVEMVKMVDGHSVMDDASTRSKFIEGVANGIEKLYPSGTSNGATAQAIVDKACYYKRNFDEYKKDVRATSWPGKVLDCWGFVATVVKNTVYPGVNGTTNAISAPGVIDASRKFIRINNITSSSMLKPGDLLFRSALGRTGHGHASIWVGKGVCGCPNGVISASIPSTPPSCGGWYDAMNIAERVK